MYQRDVEDNNKTNDEKLENTSKMLSNITDELSGIKDKIKDLCKGLGIDFSEIENIFNDKDNLSEETMEKLQELLNGDFAEQLKNLDTEGLMKDLSSKMPHLDNSHAQNLDFLRNRVSKIDLN